MKVIEEEGFCTCCHKYLYFKYGEENFSFLKKDLDNYVKYKDIFVYECKNCGFASTNVSAEEGVLYDHVKDSYEYKQLKNYAYLNGLDKKLYNNYSDIIPANLYEAYSLVCLEQKNYENFIRVINKCIDLKTTMALKYSRAKDELAGSEGNNHEYEELDTLIKQSIKTNRDQIDYYFNLILTKNLYICLIYVENLVALNQVEQASRLFEKLKKKYKLQQDLLNHFNNLIQQ